MNESGRSDTPDLVARAVAGDADAFEVLYRAHVGRVSTLARRLGGAERAEDLVQEVFLRAWQRLASFRGDSGFGTWLHRLAVRHIANCLQGAARRERRERALEQEPVAAGGDVEAGQDQVLEEAIAGLPAGAREVFVLHDVEGLTHREIADLLGVSTGTSKTQLHRARAALRRTLRARGEHP